MLIYRGETPLLYTVLPEKTAAVGGAMMGSDHVYEISGVSVTKYIRSYVHTIDPNSLCQKPHPLHDNLKLTCDYITHKKMSESDLIAQKIDFCLPAC